MGDFQGRWEGGKSCRWISRLSSGRHFHGLFQPEPTPHGEVQRTVKGVFPGVQKTQPHGSVQHFKIALVERSEPQPFVGENLADERPRAAHFQAALLRHAAHHDVIAILQLRRAARHRARRRLITTGRRAILQRLVRTLVIIFMLEAVERFLLPARIALGRPQRGLFQGRMHAFMPAVILWRSGTRTFGNNAEFHPLHRHAAEPGARLANGVPLSVWITSGRPCSRKQASNTAATCAPSHFGVMWQRNR